MPRIEFGSASDVGRVREGNEDAYALFAQEVDEPEVALIAVADGMGGHSAGEVASAIAVETLGRALFGVDGDRTPTFSERVLHDAVQAANQAIWRAAVEDPSRRGMGTTLVCALVNASGEAILANVGDSRAYLVSSGGAHALTVDHSWVTEQVQRGAMTADEAHTSPYRNVLTRSLGVGEDVQIDTYASVRLGLGEALVLCSDGVTTYLEPADFAAVVGSQEDAEAIAQELVRLSVERGGADNATAVVARMMPDERGNGHARSR